MSKLGLCNSSSTFVVSRSLRKYSMTLNKGSDPKTFHRPAKHIVFLKPYNPVLKQVDGLHTIYYGEIGDGLLFL
jgi:hypothetical protein